nr:uncharacterized protein LOC113817197 [Penaeus vannamei]
MRKRRVFRITIVTAAIISVIYFALVTTTTHARRKRRRAASDNASRHAPGAPPISVVEAVGYLAGGFVRDKEHDPFARHAFNARASNASPTTGGCPTPGTKRQP